MSSPAMLSPRDPDVGSYAWALESAKRRVGALAMRVVIYRRRANGTHGVCTLITWDKWVAGDPDMVNRYDVIAHVDTHGCVHTNTI